MAALKQLLCCSKDDGIKRIQYKVSIQTGDKKSAGTNAHVHITLHGDEGSSEKKRLDNFFKNDFEKDKKDEFNVFAMKLSKINAIELLSESATEDKWFVEFVEVENGETGEMFIFPIYRWIKSKSPIKIAHLDTSLPQDGQFQEQRQVELDRKKEDYQLKVHVEGIMPQAKEIPDDENFSQNYTFDIGSRSVAIKLKVELKRVFIPGDKWKDFDHMKEAYSTEILPVPSSIDDWKDDANFGRKRIAGLNNLVIGLCQEIPDKVLRPTNSLGHLRPKKAEKEGETRFAVTGDMVQPFLQGLTLQEAMEQKRIFIVDLELLTGVQTKEGYVVCDPMSLFFVNDKKELVPIAIQLHQKPADDNPVFLPSDPEHTWMMAKMWFNNADTAYHQSVVHLGFTHLLMEGFCVVTHRQLSLSHPIFKLLAPHFLFVIAIDGLGLTSLIGEGKWVDKAMNIGRLGMFELIRRRLKTWRLDDDGTLPKHLENKGILSEDVLPGFYFRDDALKLYNIIKNYVRSYVDIYYDTDSKLTSDWELERWSKEIVKSIEDGGLGIKGVPVAEDGKIENKENLTCILTSIIYTCSVGHAAANFQQYDEYGFPPNYPSQMEGIPPKDKTPLTEQDLLDTLPDQNLTLEIMTITKLLSEKATNSLGYFEVKYIHDPKALSVLNDFRNELQKLSDQIKESSATRLYPYQWLDPSNIPNAISI